MAELFVAAAMGEEDQAHGLAQALSLLGFDAEGGAPRDDEIAAIAEESRCVLALWSPTAEDTTALTALALLAGGKLINAEIDGAAAPEAIAAAPTAPLYPRERVGFKANFEALIGELKRLAPTRIDADALLDAMAHARAALLTQPAPPPRPAAAPWLTLPSWQTIGTAVLAMSVLFVLGFGAGRVMRDLRSGELLVATPTAIATQIEPSDAPESEPRRAPTARPRMVRAAPVAAPAATSSAAGVDWRVLERGDWRQAAQRVGDAADIKRRAARGEARAQTMACLGHLAGAPGFLPSPTAAREFCDSAAAQHEPGGLYLSWVLQRSAPHAGISSSEAQTRLAEAARLGWTAAQIDYAQTLAPNARAPLEQQAEAGRLWLAAAESGDARGQYFYARWLRDSRAGPRDPAAAAPYLERAAQNGQAEAAHMLATLYRDGVGVTRNEARARALYERAARYNHAPSMFNLADMLRRGSPQERTRAVELYKALACMRDELQIRPLAAQRLRALRESANCR